MVPITLVDSSPYCRDTSHSISRQEVGMAGNHSKSGLAQTPEIRPQLSTRPTYQFPGRTLSPAAGAAGWWLFGNCWADAGQQRALLALSFPSSRLASKVFPVKSAFSGVINSEFWKCDSIRKMLSSLLLPSHLQECSIIFCVLEVILNPNNLLCSSGVP